MREACLILYCSSIFHKKLCVWVDKKACRLQILQMTALFLGFLPSVFLSVYVLDYRLDEL